MPTSAPVTVTPCDRSLTFCAHRVLFPESSNAQSAPRLRAAAAAPLPLPCRTSFPVRDASASSRPRHRVGTRATGSARAVRRRAPAAECSAPPNAHGPCRTRSTGARHRARALSAPLGRRRGRHVGGRAGAACGWRERSHWHVLPSSPGSVSHGAPPRGVLFCAPHTMELLLINRYAGFSTAQLPSYTMPRHAAEA
jgi:hypothetical protein